MHSISTNTSNVIQFPRRSIPPMPFRAREHFDATRDVAGEAARVLGVPFDVAIAWRGEWLAERQKAKR